MNKFLISILSIFIFTSLTVDAAVYKGQSEYVKKCVKCHKAGQAFVATKKKREWSALMKDKGQKLAEIHLESDDKGVEESHEYFESKIYSKNSKHLKDFLFEYASDSGNVPACN
ncbi:MAG: cytochrome C [Sulfurimonas sp.]|nr:cytochrome C [Sulfurimonas sp.]